LGGALRAKLLPAVVVAICGALVVTGIAGAGGRAETKVTIKVEGRDFSGKVKSPRRKCMRDRKVNLYKQRGAEQRPSTDNKVASDTADLQNDFAVWNTGNTGQSGKFYARAPKTPDCKADNSRTLHTEN
jgi:hypothetical protein